jgi:hypothetical protein
MAWARVATCNLSWKAGWMSRAWDIQPYHFAIDRRFSRAYVLYAVTVITAFMVVG